LTHSTTIIKIIAVTFFLLWGIGAKALKPKKGFKALSIYDYFTAKKIFTKTNFKQANTYACYGLASIYNRNDNPFFNLDSAAKYVNYSYHLFLTNPKPKSYSGFLIDSLSILLLADSIAARSLQKIKNENSIVLYDAFLCNHYLGNKIRKQAVVYMRDELEFNKMQLIDKSDSTNLFMTTHPQSKLYDEAALLKDRQVFVEWTSSNNAESYDIFLKKNPKNVMVTAAYDKLFQLLKEHSSVSGLKRFVQDYPNAPQNLEAWKLLFSLSVKAFSDDELIRFLEEYPTFPLKNSILKELELNKLSVFPYLKNDLWGFINEKAVWVIPPMYDAVGEFSEGICSVSKNDSVIFINKENINPFTTFYAEAFTFKNGLAPVKQNGKWFFINRQSQLSSKFYDEINELSDDTYVVKANNQYGAVDHFGQIIVEPKFEQLGDFKNGFAYYLANGKYGFVSKLGFVHKPEFDWISDFDNNQFAVIKQDSKYGVINAKGDITLPAQYDQIIKANNSVYIVVRNSSYGFFNAEGCFLSPVIYDFNKGKQPEFYVEHNLLKLLHNNEQALMDINGSLLIPFGMYNDISFPSNGLLRVRKQYKTSAKYGYLDEKLKLVIPFKYSQAQNFVDSTAIVNLEDKFLLINHSGDEVFSSESKIDKLSKHYYLIHTEKKQIVNQLGNVVYTNVKDVQRVNDILLIITLESEEIKLLYD
jgi:hypothetical protein